LGEKLPSCLMDEGTLNMEETKEGTPILPPIGERGKETKN